MKPPGGMIAGKKRGVEDQGQGLKYMFLFTTHLFFYCLEFLLCIYIPFKIYIYFFKEGRLWSQTF